MIVPLMANADNNFFVPGDPIIPTAYLLRDEFTTNTPAPIPSPRTAEPGPGTWTINDAENKIALSGGKVVFSNPATPAHGDEYIVSTGIARAMGLSVLATINASPAGNFYPLWFGNDATPNGAGAGDASADFFLAGTNVGVQNSAQGLLNVATFAAATDYQLGIVLRPTGAYFLIKGGAFTNWTLLWVSNASSTATVYPAINSFNGAFSVDDYRVLRLGNYSALFASDYALATSRQAGSVSAGTTFAHTANCLLEFTVTTRPSAGNVDVFFRMQDASNYWRCRVASTGDFTLDEVVAGVATNRASASAIVSTGHRVVIITDGTTIRGFSNYVLRWTYGSASGFQSATSGKLDALGTSGVVSELIAWPRTVTMPSV